MKRKRIDGDTVGNLVCGGIVLGSFLAFLTGEDAGSRTARMFLAVFFAYVGAVFLYMRCRNGGGSRDNDSGMKWDFLDVLVIIVPTAIMALWGFWSVVICGLIEVFSK